ncbi:hypothetical protein [uncultured Maricaulis sp.]|uniref:hypothetical protein n=1 Tax=uncultured Maricaulis sp. TaxID=174710 RepID=UPI0030D8D739|tara:strand:- start:196143 stop:196577 length:435 start_codon:yes stop_codon:yes gene_type:complete
MATPIRIRSVLAFLIAPLSVGLLFFVILPFLTSPSEGIFALFFSAIIGYPVAIVLGTPTYILLNKLGWTGLFPYTLAAVAFSVILIGAFLVAPALTPPYSAVIELTSETRIVQMSALTGFISFSVLVFWLIARPDRAAGIQQVT